ncbi:rab-GTPase-TBC domain-containing protein [Limtongia smithiae]|uniref:rab-GTPase-TBC domain-containing protein n=1 Tax=Limtongia smithiae TaxID=1125753 RepID=UPI0034CDE2DB
MDLPTEDRRDSLVTVNLSDDASSVDSYQPDHVSVSSSPTSSSAPSSVRTSDSSSSGVPSRGESPLDFMDGAAVDWNELQISENAESRQSSDESTTFLLARLERENVRFERDPKALRSISGSRRRPLSVGQLRKIVEDQSPLRMSMIPNPPQLTDLEFWAALVADYPKTAAKLPFLLSKKIKKGVPPPLRGLVWQSMARSSDPTLESLFTSLVTEPSPYDKVIFRDLHRTFPEVDMFRERGGHGQQMLGQVLRAFSLYDMQVGYCQGLAFLVGPLLMHMDERNSFCVLVRLMEEYNLRTMFTAEMTGLHLRIYQFTFFMAKFAPCVSAHLERTGVHSIFVTQWFLSFYAVTCPLTLLLRIYDVIFAEGALETLIRVGVAIMLANEEKILNLTEEDEILQFLLGRNLWAVYDGNEDGLIADAMSLTSVATREVLDNLEKTYNDSETVSHSASHSRPDSPTKAAAAHSSELQAAATRFLGRIWSNVGNTNQLAPPQSRGLRRSASRGSLSSTVTAPSIDENGQYVRTIIDRGANELHTQIEELVTALSGLQKEHAVMTEEYETEKRMRGVESSNMVKFLDSLESADTTEVERANMICDMRKKLNSVANEPRPLTYKDLISKLEEAQEETDVERERVKLLRRDLDSKCVEVRDLKDKLFDVKSRYQDVVREKGKLDRMLNEVRQRQIVVRDDSDEYYDDPTSPVIGNSSPQPVLPRPSPVHGLRELRLGKQNQMVRGHFSKRSSSLFIMDDNTPFSSSPASPRLLQTPSTPVLPSTPEPVSLAPDVPPPCHSCEALKLELAVAKTGEAIARQELEESRSALDHVRKTVAASQSVSALTPSPTQQQRMVFPRHNTSPASLSGPNGNGNVAGVGTWSSKISKFGWTR